MPKVLNTNELKTLNKLLKRATQTRQVEFGVCDVLGIGHERKKGVSACAESLGLLVVDTVKDDAPAIGVYMTEHGLKSMRGAWNRKKAKPRTLDSGTASEMAKIRHAKK